MKPIVFHPKARDAIRGFPQDVRDRLGKALYLLQMGEHLGMPLSRSMPVIGSGVAELRVRGVGGHFRVLYFAASDEGIMVMHAFAKKTSQTPDSDIQLARKRLKEMLHDK